MLFVTLYLKEDPIWVNQRVSEVTLCSALEDMTAGEDSILPFNALSCFNVASNFNSFYVFYTL